MGRACVGVSVSDLRRSVIYISVGLSHYSSSSSPHSLLLHVKCVILIFFQQFVELLELNSCAENWIASRIGGDQRYNNSSVGCWK